MVAEVAAHENKGVGVGAGASQPAEVAEGVAWGVEEEEGAVAEEVEGAEGAGFEGG